MNTDFLNHHYTLILEQLNEVPLGELTGTKDLVYTPALIEIGELTFNYPKYTTGDTGEKVKTPLYDELEADTLLRVDNQEVFYVNQCIEIDGGEGTAKRIHAYSRQYELSLKAINDYDPDGERLLYFLHPSDSPKGFPWEIALPVEDGLAENILGTKDSSGAYYGIFNLIETLTSWKLKRRPDGIPEIPVAIQKEGRKITTSEMNLLELMKALQEAWNCVFHYDTKKREISIYDELLFDRTPTGVLSDENFVKSLTKELQTEEIRTRLFLYDERGSGILAERLAHGGSYVEDYSYFMKDKYMSTQLQSALAVYFQNLELLKPSTEVIWARLKALFNERMEADNLIQGWQNDLVDPLARYEHYMSLRDGFQTETEFVPGVQLQPHEEEAMRLAAEQIEILDRKIQLYTSGNLTQKPRSLQQIEVFIKAEKNSLRSLQNQGMMSAVFANYETERGLEQGSLMKEMEPYIRDGTHQSESIASVNSLYKLGLDMLSYVSKPRLAFSIDVVDFLDKMNLNEFDYLATLGTVIEIQNKELEFSDRVILLKYAHSPDTGGLTLEFSNQLSSKDDTTFLAELIAKSNAVSSKVNFSSEFWNKGGAIGDAEVVSNSSFGSVHLQSKRLQTVGMDAMRISTDTKFQIQDGLIESKITEVQVTDLIENSTVNGRNLVLIPELQYTGNAFVVDGYDLKLNATSSSNSVGLRLGNSLMEGALDYVLSFKIRKDSGSITTLGGPSGVMEPNTIRVWRNGVLVKQGEFLDTYPNNSAENEYEIHFTSKALITDWIQILPNYSHYGLAYTATISDLQLERGRKKTAWKPSVEDVAERVVKNESSIRQQSDQIELKVSKGDIASTINQTAQSVSISASKIDLSGYATFSSLSSPGYTSIDGANIKTGTISANRLDLSGVATFSQASSLANNAASAAVSNRPTYWELANANQTTINGGNITTGKISASYINFDNATGTNVNLSGKLTASLGLAAGTTGHFTVPPNADGVFNNYGGAARWKLDNGNYIYQDSATVTFYFSGDGATFKFMRGGGTSPNLGARGIQSTFEAPSFRMGNTPGGIVLSAGTDESPQLQVRDVTNSAYIDIASSDFVVSSSQDFKKNIKPTKTKLDMVKNTGVFEFEYREPTGEIKLMGREEPRIMRKRSVKQSPTKIGFIAESSPDEMVMPLKEGEIGISVTNTVAILWKAVQELSAEVDKLKAERVTT